MNPERISSNKVIIESPYAGNIEKNVEYARKCMKDSFARGEFPFASHLLYPQPGILKDHDPEERELGIRAGLEWGIHAEKTVVYCDLGISKGMLQGIQDALDNDRIVEYRSLTGNTVQDFEVSVKVDIKPIYPIR